MYGHQTRKLFSEAELKHYFDGVERQRMDIGSLSKKSGKWLAIREKLFKLPDPAFDVVMRSLESMIDGLGEQELPNDQKNHQKNQERRQAMALFERAAEADAQQHSTTSTSKIHSV